MLKVALVIIISLLVLSTSAVIFGRNRWRQETDAVRRGLEASRVSPTARTVDLEEVDGLPAPARRFFRTALTDGQPLVEVVHMQHTGMFNMGETTDRWKPFTSDQIVLARRPGFDWHAQIQLAPGVHVRVHDAYIAGEGHLHASLFGLFSVAELRGTGSIAEGELLRFVAEAIWYPTVLLPSQGVRWEPIDSRSASATLTDGELSVRLSFQFNDAGLVDTVHAEARGRMVNGELVPTRWKGRFWNYTSREGMQIPEDGEVAWALDSGDKAYWRGHMSTLSYEFAK